MAAWMGAPMSRAIWLIAGMLLAVGVTGCEHGAEPAAPQFLNIDEADLIVGPKKGAVYIFADLHPYRETLGGLSEKEADDLLRRTASHLCETVMAREKYRQFTRATVDFASIPNKDEYGRGQFSSMMRHGSVSLERASSGKIEIRSDTILYRASGK